jgi:YD repeat-containing protein
MTSIVIGGGLGVVGSSATQVNGSGISGQGKVGQGNDLAVVNATNGNLILQGKDEFIAGIGIDDALLRTYNSQGTLDGDNNDGWRLSLFRSLRNNGNNTFTRIAADGHQELLSSVGTGVWRSLEGEGGGAHDVLRTVSTPRVTGEAYEYEAGGSGVFEMYDSTGKLLGWRDDSGNVTTLTYTGSLVTSVSDSSGQTVTLTYGAGAASSDLLSMQITARAIGAPGTPATFYTQTRVTYTYDSQHRLSQVKVDLTPYKSSDATNANQADNSFYYTTYQYDGTSTRVTKITQSTDQAGTAVNSSLTIAYVVQGNVYRVSTLTDAQGRATQFHYDLNKGRTDVTDALGNVTSYFYDNQGRLVGVESPDIGGGKRTLTSYQYDANNNIIAVTDAEGRSVHYAYDADGNVKEIRDQTGNTIRRLYDADDRLLAETVFQTSAAANYGAAEPANITLILLFNFVVCSLTTLVSILLVKRLALEHIQQMRRFLRHSLNNPTSLDSFSILDKSPRLKILIWTKSYRSWIEIADCVQVSTCMVLLVAGLAQVVNLICNSCLGITLL